MRKRHAARTSDRQPIAWGYCRVSTIEQAASSRRLNTGVGMSLEAQHQAISDFIQRNLPDHIFIPEQHMVQDAASASKKPFLVRPGGREIWERIRPNDALVCAKVDRAFRSTHDQAITLHEFSKRGVSVYFLDCPEISGASGEFLCSILGAAARFESRRRSERILEANEILRQQKRRYWGGRARAWGFRYAANGQIVPFPEEQAIMRQVWIWREVEKKSWHEIEYLIEKQLCEREGREVLHLVAARKPKVSPLHKRCKWNDRVFTMRTIVAMHRVHQKWIEIGYMPHPLKEVA